MRFVHQFKEPGSYITHAKINVTDDLGLDDESDSVCNVVDRLGVLIVDGSNAERFMDRASAFALALAPAILEKSQTSPADKAAKSGVALDPEVIPLSRAAR